MGDDEGAQCRHRQGALHPVQRAGPARAQGDTTCESRRLPRRDSKSFNSASVWGALDRIHCTRRPHSSRWAASRRRSRNGRWPCGATPSSPRLISAAPEPTSGFANGTWPSPTSSRPPRGPSPHRASSWQSYAAYFQCLAERPDRIPRFFALARRAAVDFWAILAVARPRPLLVH